MSFKSSLKRSVIAVGLAFGAVACAGYGEEIASPEAGNKIVDACVNGTKPAPTTSSDADNQVSVAVGGFSRGVSCVQMIGVYPGKLKNALFSGAKPS